MRRVFKRVGKANEKASRGESVLRDGGGVRFGGEGKRPGRLHEESKATMDREDVSGFMRNPRGSEREYEWG